MQPGRNNQSQFPPGQQGPGWYQGPPQGGYPGGAYPQQQAWGQPGGYPGGDYAGLDPQAAYQQYQQPGMAYQQPSEAQQPYATGLARPGMASMQDGWNDQMQQAPYMQPAQMAPGVPQQQGRQPENAEEQQFESLVQYLEDCTDRDEFAKVSVLQKFVKKGGSKACNEISEEGYNSLHLLVMLGAANLKDAAASVKVLLQGGASVNTKDPDGETPLDAALSIAADSDDEEDEEEEKPQSGKPNRQSRQLVRASFMKVLITDSQLEIDEDRLQRICAFARKHAPSDREDELLAAVKKRVSPDVFNRVWESEELLTYLQDCCYEKSCGAEPAIVAGHLQRGAWANYQPKEGVGPLHLVALNPYHRYTQVREVTRLLMESDPKCAEVRDRFNLTALQWAEDYINLAKQHNMQYASASTLLAFAEFLPEGLDSGLVCIKIGSMKYQNARVESGVKRPSLRFAEGDRVRALVAVPGGQPEWEEGAVVSLWLRNICFPKEHPGLPYEVLLDLGTRVLCLADRPDLIRAENDTTQEKPTPAATTAPKKEAKPKRFEKRKRPDGKWELFDTKTGNAKMIPTPDTSDED